jgi:hypothetical protein
MAALDAEFVGSFAGWFPAAMGLRQAGLIDDQALTDIRWLDLFGRLIANTDMHGGNLAFFARGVGVTGLAPAYDLSPSLYAPIQGHLRPPRS